MSTVLFERYKVEKILGRGSAGQVYLCHDTLIGSQRVAVKVLPSWIIDCPKHRARIASEILILNNLNSPYIVRCLDYHHNEECSAIVMEYVNGETLRSLIDSKQEMTQHKKFSIALQLLEGLAHIHQYGLVHRDIKPENIIISPEGNLKIIDFGLITAKGTDREVPLIRNSTIISNAIVGTAFYLAPEIIDGGQITQRADVYAATMAIFELFTGSDLFEDEGFYKLFESKSNGAFGKAFKKLPEDLQRFITKGTAPNPKERFKNAAAMWECFDKIVLNELRGKREDHQDIGPLSAFASSTYPVLSSAYQSGKFVQFSLQKLRRDRKAGRLSVIQKTGLAVAGFSTIVWTIFLALLIMPQGHAALAVINAYIPKL